MSDGTPSVAAAAPTSAPEAAVVETTVQTTPEVTETPKLSAKEAAAKWRNPKQEKSGLSAREAKESLARRANSPRETSAAPEAAAETPAVTEQPRDEQGRFAAAEAPAAEAPKVETPTAEGRVPIPAGHTIRETRGKQYMDELELHELKPFVNEATWSKIQESLRAQNTAQQEASRRSELERQYAEQRARAEVLSDPATDPLSDPTVRQIHEDLKRAYGDEAAAKWLKQHEAQREQVVSEKADTIARELAAQNAARTFLSDVSSVKETFARNRYTAWQGSELDSQLDAVLDVFVPLVEAGREKATREAFYRFADMMYLRDPRAQAALTQAAQAQQARLQQETAEKARREAEEAAKAAEAERLLQAAANRKTIPLAGVGGSGVAAPQGSRPPNAREARKQLDARYRATLTGR